MATILVDCENEVGKIWDFVKDKKKQSQRELYTGTLHCFGRKDGVLIYRLLKKGMEECIVKNECIMK